MKIFLKPVILLSMLAVSLPVLSQEVYRQQDEYQRRDEMQSKEEFQRREELRHEKIQRHMMEERQQARNNPEYETSIINEENSLIQLFQVNISDNNFRSGSTLKFTVDGEQNAVVSVKFNSDGRITRVIKLRETEPGHYTGSYVVRNVDQLANKTFIATMNYKKKSYVAKFEPTGYTKPQNYSDRTNNDIQGVYSDQRTTQHTDPRYVQPVINRDFGTVIAVEPIQLNAESVNIGSVLGAAAGGLLGNQVGGGNGKTAATVIGALGGAFAGNQVGQTHTTQYRVTVQFEDSSRQSYMFNNTGDLAINAKVRRSGDTLVLR